MPIEFYTSADTDDLIKSLKKDVENIKVNARNLADIIAKEGVQHAKRLAADRMPSGGGSYKDSIHSAESGIGNQFSVKIMSDHEWAQAVEYGTKRHDIVAKFGGMGSHAASKAVRASIKIGENKFRKPKKPILIQRPKELGWGLALGIYDPVDAGRSVRQGWRGEKLQIAKTYRPVIAIIGNQPMYDPAYLKEISGLDYQVTMAHELLHRYTAKKMGHMKMYEAAQDPQKHAYLEELADRSHPLVMKLAEKARAAGKAEFSERIIKIDAARTMHTKTYDVTKAGGGRLIFDKSLPRGSKGYGTKYEDFKFVGEKVTHPGARAFHIFGDTQSWITNNLDIFISEAFMNNVQRKRS